MKTLLYLLMACSFLTACHSFTHLSRYGYEPKYKIVEEQFFDYNKDGVRDVVLVLNDTTTGHELNEEPPYRFIILEGQKDRTFKQILENDSVLRCPNCGHIGFVRYDSLKVTDTTISFQDLSIWTRDPSHYTTIVFRYDQWRNSWVLSTVVDRKICDIDNGDGPVDGCEERELYLKENQIMPAMHLKNFNVYHFDPDKYL